MRLWVSQIDVIAQEQQSESGGGVTGTQHAPVESQIETVPSVGAQLAPGRHTGLRWHQADTQTATQHEFLGVHVTGSGIRPSPRLVQGIVDMAVPKTLKDVRSCVGALNFHRRFIPAFAEKIHSLNKLSLIHI